MSVLASVLVNEVATILNDMDSGFEHTRWPEAELLGYLSEGIFAIAQGKPSAFVTVAILPLAPGSTQRLSDEYSRLIDIHFNLNRDGSEGWNVLPGVYQLQQAFEKPGCENRGLIETYAAYPGSERFYWVDPPVPAGLNYTPQVQALVMLAPQPVTAMNQPVVFAGGTSQLYQGALIDWMLYRAYSKDEESATSYERSQAHFKAFQGYLGLAMSQATNPDRKSVV